MDSDDLKVQFLPGLHLMLYRKKMCVTGKRKLRFRLHVS